MKPRAKWDGIETMVPNISRIPIRQAMHTLLYCSGKSSSVYVVDDSADPAALALAKSICQGSNSAATTYPLSLTRFLDFDTSVY